jgi:hypothetical protein
MSDTLSVNRCSCGWQFYAFNEWVKKCPQCRDEINTCINCGADISHKTGKARYCDKCKSDNKKIIDKYRMRDKRSYFKESIGNICNYDCANCQFSDCILPVDPDDKQEELF